MKYQQPEMDLLVFEQESVIHTSELGNGGTGFDTEDPFQLPQ